MAKIAYILLCHKDPDAVIKQAERLTAAGDFMAIHFDASASKSDYLAVRNALADNPAVTFAHKQMRCGWGEWSLVQATLYALESALDAFPRATHFYMLSGDCMPIKSAEYVHQFLNNNDCDFIESVDYFDSWWIKTGWREERLIYRHWFNERTQKKRFYAMFELQKRLGLTREIPSDLQMMIGSQWWCLRRRTVEMVLKFARKRRDIVRFFKSTWIPDETFFQTIVRHLIPSTQIQNRTLTCLVFSDYGMPVVFYNDHYDLLLGQDFLFARKISPEAEQLKQRLGLLYAAEGTEFQISNEARKLFEFLTGRGRIGRRFGPRFWESEATFGRGRALMIVVCKKWHVAKRFCATASAATPAPILEYLFNEEATALPDLGGIQDSMAKRHRHRRALLRMLFDYYDKDQLIICLDPSNLELLKDVASERTSLRILEIQCSFSDVYLKGHAKRVGLAGDHTNQETLDRLLPTIRDDIQHESDRLSDTEFKCHYTLREGADHEDNARAVAAFLDIEVDAAAKVAAKEDLFAD
ncbi:MAG: DUF5928 domain-containing protein [Paracoccaceae bacterium]